MAEKQAAYYNKTMDAECLLREFFAADMGTQRRMLKSASLACGSCAVSIAVQAEDNPLGELQISNYSDTDCIEAARLRPKMVS